MPVIQGKSTFKKILYSPIIVLLLGVLCLLLAFSVYDLYQKKKHTEEARDQVKQEQALLAEEKVQLEHKLSLLATKEGMETVVREKESVARPGERVIIVQDAVATTTQEEPPGIFTRFWRAIKNLF